MYYHLIAISNKTRRVKRKKNYFSRDNKASPYGSGFSEVDTLEGGINSNGDPQSVYRLCGRRPNSVVAVETFPVGRECASKRSPSVEMIP